ncbi:MFS transporter [Amycolatopsis sp. NPDC058340]|uniref:MFS transporter n=1 Tax=Amycolatopsis sp. NPDC058340 TaxID=3346453 RepID=UPI0036612954
MIESKRLPAGVYLLAFSLFAMGSAEFLMAGVLPAAAADLGVSLSSAGALITAFALGVVLGGPPFAVLSLKWPRRTALMTTQAVFAAAIAVGLLADDYWILLITRFVAGLAYAGFFAVAAVTAISLVTPDRNARASGVVVAGLSVAMVAGGPVGTLLSNLTDWTGGFWGVVTLTAVGVIASAVGLPATAASAEAGLSGELRAMRTPRLWGVYAITILSTAAYMVSFNYLAAMLADVVPAVWIPAVLALFGIGAFAGLSIGGRISDRRPHHALLGGGAGIAVFSAILALFATSVWVVVPTVFLLGVAAFVLNPALYGRVFTIAASAPTLAGATTVSAFQLGISLTPAFAAGALNLGASLAAIPWIGAGLALVTVALVLVC